MDKYYLWQNFFICKNLLRCPCTNISLFPNQCLINSELALDWEDLIIIINWFFSLLDYIYSLLGEYIRWNFIQFVCTIICNGFNCISFSFITNKYSNSIWWSLIIECYLIWISWIPIPWWFRSINISSCLNSILNFAITLIIISWNRLTIINSYVKICCLEEEEKIVLISFIYQYIWIYNISCRW